jgi:hypothetical protein
MNLGSGSTYSENMSAASGGPGGSQNQGPSGFGDGDSGGGNDVYSGYVQHQNQEVVYKELKIILLVVPMIMDIKEVLVKT